MKSNNKLKYIISSLLVILIGRYISEKYGQEANEKFTIIVLELVILGLMVIVIYLVAKKYYRFAIGLVALVIPFVMCAIGLYIKNLTLIIIGVILLIIVITVEYIILKKICKNKNK